MTQTSDQLDSAEINQTLAASSPEKIVAWAHGQFAPNLVMTSSFGAESAVLIHMATRVMPDIRIVFIDTGFLFPETHAFMEQLRHRFDLNVWTYRTPNDPIAYLKQAGETDPTERKDRDACCAANKNIVLERALQELAPRAFLRGVRADQTEFRRQAQILSWSERYNCHAVSPLLNWSRRDIHGYMKRHDLPYHPLYEQGYLSIGCNPLSCTRAIQAGEDPRAGRWDGVKAECGINLLNSLDSANL